MSNGNFPHRNVDLDGIRYLFKLVERKELDSAGAMKRLIQAYGGYMVYFPSTNRKRFVLLKKYYAEGLPVDEAAKKAKVGRSWVKKVYKRLGLAQKQGTPTNNNV